MKTILVAIDFSDCSINALEHALSISEKSGSDIILLWVNRPDPSKEIFSVESENLISEVEKRFNSLIEKYSKSYSSCISFKIRSGKIYEEIIKEADDSDVFMIVTGTHGISGFEAFWVGSNAFKVVSSAYVPVLTIRAGIDIGRELKKIVLPIDSTPETRQKVIFTSILAALFDAEIHVISLYSSSSRNTQKKVDRFTSQVIEHLKDEGIRYLHNSITAENLTDATIEYAEKINANLIAIMTEQEWKAKNILMGPYASQMVNHSPIPVLSIHPKEIINTVRV